MDGQSTQPRKAQLDKEQREHLEDIVIEMRDRVEANVRYQLEDKYDLTEKPDEDVHQSEEQEDLVEAIELEVVDANDWEEGYEQYITSVGYTIVNRLAALRCMEVRDFIDDEVTAFRDDGLTPAADRLVTEEFMLEEEAVLEAYRNACDDLAEEIEILFDRSTAYSLIDPDDDTFEDLCGMLDEVSDEVWRGDDVLGWVYEYYNRGKLSELRKKARNEGLDIEDIAPANQFYTPHWVVRMLADNSLGKYYQEATGGVQDLINEQSDLSVEARTNRTSSKASNISELCTYIVPDNAPNTNFNAFDHPSEIQVIDPACGSGHFLLYCFDILERIWQQECPEKNKSEIPRLILEHNLYGVDIDLRACQLAAFNLYLKARGRSEEFGNNDFELPELGIVCSDASIADIDSAEQVFDEVADDEGVRRALQEILDAFENKQGLGSLLDVRTTLSEEFLQDQTKITDDWGTKESLSSFLDRLRNTIKKRKDESFLAQDLRSFLRLLAVLSDEYDVALMNPPYGSQRRMPESVKSYVRENYDYHPEYYINFFEVCERLVKEEGRIGMLVPRSFMFNQSFKKFREDFIGERGNFDFLAEFGLGILDNATVRTAGTVVRAGQASQSREGTFFRLHDVDPENKEEAFVNAAYENAVDNDGIQRLYRKKVSSFQKIPGAHISYWMPDDLREIYDSNVVFDSNNANVDKDSLGVVKQGTTTGDNARFVKYFWEQSGGPWIPFAKGGEDAWILPRVNQNVLWGDNGDEIRRYDGSVPQNTQYFFEEALTYTVAKETGRRFGYLHPTQAFDAKGSVFIPDRHIWELLGYSNSQLITYLMLCQTPERMWQVGMVSKLPWEDQIAEETDIDRKAKDMLSLMLSRRQTDLISPYFEGPLLLQPLSEGQSLDIHEHPHRELLESVGSFGSMSDAEKSDSLQELGEMAESHITKIQEELEKYSDEIDESLYEYFEISEKQIQDIRTEIELRTAESFRDEDLGDNTNSALQHHVKELLHYFTLEATMNKKDGIVPVDFHSDERDSIFDYVVEKFEQIWGDHSEARLAEVDQILGSKRADEVSYPNIREWLKNELFVHHLSEFENTPILWKLTSERLISDSDTPGFSCFIDYHSLDANIFDQISNRYLEVNRSALRERRSSANQRRSDESLSTTERSKATSEFEKYTNALEQLSEFEEVIQDLSSPNPRDWTDENQQTAKDLQSKVKQFRKKTQKKLDKLDELAKINDVKMDKLFTPTFYPTVEDKRTEWINALEELESACQAYSKAGSEPVEAHYYDLFDYFDDLIGSTHFASNGILFMTYYFEQGEDYLEDGEPRDGLREDISILAELAVDLNQYIDLAEAINQDCQDIMREIPSSWHTRALSEITTQGYNPVQKHGVNTNIKPLAEKEVVPKIIDDKVL